MQQRAVRARGRGAARRWAGAREHVCVWRETGSKRGSHYSFRAEPAHIASAVCSLWYTAP